MAYVTHEYFTSLYDQVDEKRFANLEWEARRIVDAHTTGVDNVRKLRVAFPVDEDDAEAVRRCMGKLIKLIMDIEDAEKGRGLIERPDGSVSSGVVSSISSGSESISYAADGGRAIDAAVSDISARNKLYSQTVRQMLSGVSDANGVSLLYVGVYPYVR